MEISFCILCTKKLLSTHFIFTVCDRIKASMMSDLDGEFGIVQGDDFHGGDNLAGLLDLPSGNKIEVGLFH